MKGKVNFPDEILGIKLRKVSFKFLGLRCYKISPPVISVPSRYEGFDFYIAGKFNHQLSILVCYKKITEMHYEMVKLYELSSRTLRSTAEAEMAARFFEKHYLKKQLQYEITTKQK